MTAGSPKRFVIDPIHGRIELMPEEWDVVDTPTFQRLRTIKQLQFGHLTYPNATHTRFAHSLGVTAIMQNVLRAVIDAGDQVEDEDIADLRLAALLHDVGHYPYSHLLEGVDNVRLTEEEVHSSSGQITLNLKTSKYPNHEEVGKLIVTHQRDLLDVIGNTERAERIAGIFTRTVPKDAHIGRLIHSSLDMDRLDYLIRDARSCGVPYGEIDLNYLMANFKISPSGMIGIAHKATAAAEHFLLARFYMHRSVYFHKTTFGLEEACRQLLRRCRDQGRYNVPADGEEIKSIVTSDFLLGFGDSFVDRIIQEAMSCEDEVISSLANCIAYRRPPVLLKEVSGFFPIQQQNSACTAFLDHCRYRLVELSEKYSIPLGQFLLAKPKPVSLEKRGGRITAREAIKLQDEEQDELIKVFAPGNDEPVSLVDLDHGVLGDLAEKRWECVRLYVIPGQRDDEQVRKMKEEIASW